MTPTTTTVIVPSPARPQDDDTFRDLTDANVVEVEWQQGGLAITFDGVLDADTTARVYDRLVSPSDANEAIRVRLRGYRAALALGNVDVVPAALGDLIVFVLGDVAVTTSAVAATADAITSGAVALDDVAPADVAALPAPEDLSWTSTT